MKDDIEKVELRWSYKPKNFIQDDITIKKNDIDITFSDGEIIATMDFEVFSSDNEITSKLSELVRDRLTAIQILDHKQFTLSNPPSRHEHLKDGRTKVFVHQIDGIGISESLEVTAEEWDKDGNLISDSKKAKKEKEKWLGQSINKLKSFDNTLAQMLNSHEMAVIEPHNEFIHLYEICDALKVKFGSQSEAENILDIDDEWSLLGRLANNEPYKQSRHRGKFSGNLKDAPQKELDKARKAARIIIEKYLKYLDKNT